MALTGYKSWAVDSAGNVVPNAAVEVRRKADNSLASLFTDVTGGAPITNPFTAGSDGGFEFYVTGDRYDVIVGSGPSQVTVPFDAVDAKISKTSPYNRDTVADLVADTVLAYTAAVGRVAVSVGDCVKAQGFRYKVAASGASDHHITTAGGVKLYVQPIYMEGTGGAFVVTAFGASGDGASNDTAAIQAAINTGRDVIIPNGVYLCAGLTLNNNQQQFSGMGQARLTKNNNGAIITGAGNDLSFSGLIFDGESASFTGDNISLTGDRITFEGNCGSQDAAGRALKCTGSNITVIGGSNIWATVATGASAFDIEIGVSGTATLYHYLSGIRTGNADAGILLTDTGNHTLVGGQFGKLSIKRGTAPGGVNGGATTGCRIIGDVVIEASNATIVGNAISSSAAVTFAAGTSACRWIGNTNPATLTNNGNANNYIEREVSTGGTYDVKFGDDASTMVVKYAGSGETEYPGNVVFPNNRGVRIKDSGGTIRNAVTLSTGDDWTFGADTGANFLSLACGAVGGFLVVSGVSEFQWNNGYFRPIGDGSDNLGGPSNRWATVYATTGTINTSDAREKTDIRPLAEAEMRAAKRCKGLIRAFRWRDAGLHGGQTHFGVIAQDVIEAFAVEGLDALEYGVVVHDEWDARAAVVRDGVEIEPAREAGDRYGVRYEQLLAFVIAAI